MTSTGPDTTALPISPAHIHGLVMMAARMLEKSEADADVLLGALIGQQPTYGSLHGITAELVQEKAHEAGVNNLVAAHVKAFAGALLQFSAETLVCSHCGDLSLKGRGALVVELGEDTACPFCRSGAFQIVSMTLRRVHWVTGELVDAGVVEDTHTVPGVFIPLTDDKIEAWVENVHASLLEAREESGVPLYALLAVLNLRRNEFRRGVAREAMWFLENPSTYGIAGGGLSYLVNEAALFIDEREVSNRPHRVFLSDGVRRKDLWSIDLPGQSFLVEGLVGRGDKCDVYRGRRDGVPTERVIIKVLVAPEDADLLKREVQNVERLWASDERGSQLFKKTVPLLVTHGDARMPDGSTRPALVYRDIHGFDYTLEECHEAYPQGVDVKTAVWMVNRLLMQLSWIHDSGLIHCSMLPEHLLCHPRDHTINVIDWSAARRKGDILNVGVSGREAFYPPEIFAQEPVTEQTDIAMFCRTMIYMLGGDPKTGSLPTHVPATLGNMLVHHARYTDDRRGLLGAFDFYHAWGQAAEAVYGPRKYHVFEMPRSAARS